MFTPNILMHQDNDVLVFNRQKYHFTDVLDHNIFEKINRFWVWILIISKTIHHASHYTNTSKHGSNNVSHIHNQNYNCGKNIPFTIGWQLTVTTASTLSVQNSVLLLKGQVSVTDLIPAILLPWCKLHTASTVPSLMYTQYSTGKTEIL